MASPNRDRLFVQPLGTSRRLALHASRNSPGVRLAEIDRSGHPNPDDIFGWLTLLPSGTYVIEQVQGSIRYVDQRKAEAAVTWVESQMAKLTDQEKMDIAELVRGFVEEGNLTVSRAAQMLGIPKRTLENVVQGRGFPYPKLLALAIQAFRSTPDR